MLNLDVDSSDEEVVNKIFNEDDPSDFIQRSNTTAYTDDTEIEEEIDGPGIEFLKAAEKGNIEDMTRLLEEDPTLISFKDSDEYTALHRAAYSEQVEALKFLISRNADISARTEVGWTPLHSACRWNSSACASLLLKHGADINALTQGGLTPLHIAAENAVARETLIVLLVNPKLNPDIKNPNGETGEQVASQHGSFAYLFELVRKSIIHI